MLKDAFECKILHRFFDWLQRCFEILWDPSAFMGVFRILDDALGCFGILAASMDVFRGLGDAEGCSEMLRDAQRCFGVQDSPQILRLIPAMLWDALRCFEMLWDSLRFFEILWDSKCVYGRIEDFLGMLRDALRWLKVALDPDDPPSAKHLPPPPPPCFPPLPPLPPVSSTRCF